MFARKYEATPVPVQGSGIRPSELRSLVYVERRVGIPRPPPLVIDLTQDEEEEYQIPSRNEPLDMTSHFAALAIKPRESPSTPRPLHSESSSNSHRSAAQRTPRDAQAASSTSGSADRRSNKRKESESGEEEDVKRIWSTKRRLRPRKQVAYAETDVGDEMDLDDELHNPIISMEQDGDGEYDSDGGQFDVERVIAQRTGPNGMHEYLLAWVGYTELNWIPAQNCNCAELIAQFHAVPQFDFPAQSKAAQQLIEQERIRWLDRYAGRRAETPARPVRAQGLRTARNPRTGRFERKRVENSLPQMGSPLPQIGHPPQHIRPVVTNSEDHGDENIGFDEEVDALMNAVNNLLRDAEDNEIDIPFPGMRPFDALSHDSNQRLSEPPRHEGIDGWQEERAYDTISIRQTPAIEDIILPVAHASQPNQRRRQTAKIYWERDTPGAEQEQTSFMQIRTTDADGLATTYPEAGQNSLEHPAQASRWLAVKSKPARLPPSTSWSAINAQYAVSSGLIPDQNSSSTSFSGGPASYRRTKSGSPLSVLQVAQPATSATARTAQLSWDNQLRAAFSPPSNAGLSSDTSQPPVPEMAQSSQSPCRIKPLRDADSESPEPEQALGVRLPFGLAMSQAMEALYPGDYSDGASTTLINLPSLLPVQQSKLFNTGPRGQGDPESQCAANVVGEKTDLQQAKPTSISKSSDGSVIESQMSHGFVSENVRTSNATHRRRRKRSVAKSPLLQSRVSTNRNSSNTKPGHRKIITALRRGTDAIEAEIASTTGPHLASKKTVAAVLSTASTNALRRPAFVQKQTFSTKTREHVRSPSVATKEFMEAREQERREKEAPTLIRAEVNRDYGPYYPKGLSLIAQSLAAESRMSATRANLSRVFPKTRHGFNFSDDIPRPSIEG